MRLEDKISVVIGGGSGIGAAIAARFAAEGSIVYATSRKPFVSPDQGRIIPVVADAGLASDVKQLYDRVREERGGIDVLVLNAGMSEYAELGGISEDLYDRIFDLNVRSLLFAAQNALELIPDNGSIVLIGSIADAIGPKGYGVYSASKAAVRSFTRTWANELAPRGIRVNVVSPGPTDTAMMAATTDEVRAALTGMIPLGRLGRPDEVAAAALFLASSESSFTTGAELCVDGGATQV
ncbi:NAD(P)-dependent dehydrogenase (short-subunit alcohol dehydrogenase family) [Rhizobium sp. ERR 922]|uniref:SDR family NAD(P)-dependent oxidoreductase n=1 Tax=Rhizobium TaxID=379 RepID=UPI000DDFAECD|nr:MULTISPECIES: SDR family oxidoreductase [Rhizobium]MCZ3374819.1 SDR family oxidoreductase [Rhizobium sp. AG207R]TWB43551.1 NAD(P)-dependent dehydrogenase (short-subunit alcohol dehydrogenase family) [Rhizobium sp. ERR 922]TWB87366.1 NAD(P)-dependent dehydrogenase (short-subunit alcohol dehydrogenase family) [Rhizobium sp. ERR 942]GES41271.1 short-chain dehydrogenase [Rhizobium dioscoreae]